MTASRQNYKVGIYVRLSQDDERTGDSVSIENQKNMLIAYCNEQGFSDYSVYQDDGYSGTNFERPGVQRLLTDVQEGKINLILVKDLSRFGRNYILIGQYMDYIFPAIGCRFIALGDNVDTLKGSNDLAPVKNLFNEWHARDTGNKTKAVKRACFKEGKYMGAYAPYGYRKDVQDKHRLAVDEAAAAVVRKIFFYRTLGYGYQKIAGLINAAGHLPPRDYYYLHSGNYGDNGRRNHRWNDVAIKKLVHNEVYIGHMVQGKTGTVSFKNQHIMFKPQEEWIKVEHTHEPIIDMETWETVQAVNSQNTRIRSTKENKITLFGGVLRCADCGFKLRFVSEGHTKKNGEQSSYVSYMCGSYARSGKSACSAHKIKSYQLERIVLEDIRENARCALADEQAVRAKLMQDRSRQTQQEQKAEKAALKAAEKRLCELQRLTQAIV